MNRRRSALSLVALAVAAIALQASACGPSSDDPDPAGGAQRQWDGFRRLVADLADARPSDRAQARANVCASLAEPLRRALADRHGGGGLPECTFIDRVPVLDGRTRFGPLEVIAVAEEPYPLTVRGRVREERDGGVRSRPVELRQPNPGNWEVSRLGGLP